MNDKVTPAEPDDMREIWAAIDVMRPQEDLFRATLKNTRTLELQGQPYRIPTLEMALALKFAAMISPKMARDQKLTDGDVISLTRGNFKVEAPVMVQPGHSDDSVSIALGYGRQRCGRVGKDVGAVVSHGVPLVCRTRVTPFSTK